VDLDCFGIRKEGAISDALWRAFTRPSEVAPLGTARGLCGMRVAGAPQRSVGPGSIRAKREQNKTSQALQDALTVREFLFSSIPQIRLANLKVYRTTAWRSLQLIITGSVNREDVPPPRIASLVMRAKLYGLHFELVDGALGPLDLKANEGEFTTEPSCHGRTQVAENI